MGANDGLILGPSFEKPPVSGTTAFRIPISKWDDISSPYMGNGTKGHHEIFDCGLNSYQSVCPYLGLYAAMEVDSCSSFTGPYLGSAPSFLCWEWGCFQPWHSVHLLPVWLERSPWVVESTVVAYGGSHLIVDVLIAFILLAFFGTIPLVCYVEGPMPSFGKYGLSTKVYGARLRWLKLAQVSTCHNHGKGQCFWRAVSQKQKSWQRAKHRPLSQMLPSKAHSSQLSKAAWASHVEVGAYAQAYEIRVILISAMHGRVFHFVPRHFHRTVYILHSHDHYERISGFKGHAYAAQDFKCVDFGGSHPGDSNPIIPDAASVVANAVGQAITCHGECNSFCVRSSLQGGCNIQSLHDGKSLQQEPLHRRVAVPSHIFQRPWRSSFFSQQLCPFWACFFSCCLFAVLGGGPPAHIRPPPRIMFESDAAYRECIQSRFGYFVDDFDNWHPLFNKPLSTETYVSLPALALSNVPFQETLTNTAIGVVAGGSDSESSSKRRPRDFYRSKSKKRTPSPLPDFEEEEVEVDEPMKEEPLEEEAPSQGDEPMIRGSTSAYVDPSLDPEFLGDYVGDVDEEANATSALPDLTPEEIAEEVGESCKAGTALLIAPNQLRACPPGIGGKFKDSHGSSHLAYPPLVVLAQQSFFRFKHGEFEDGFYCLFCRWNRWGGVLGTTVHFLLRIHSTFEACRLCSTSSCCVLSQNLAVESCGHFRQADRARPLCWRSSNSYC